VVGVADEDEGECVVVGGPVVGAAVLGVVLEGAVVGVVLDGAVVGVVLDGAVVGVVLDGAVVGVVVGGAVVGVVVDGAVEVGGGSVVPVARARRMQINVLHGVGSSPVCAEAGAAPRARPVTRTTAARTRPRAARRRWSPMLVTVHPARHTPRPKMRSMRARP